MIKGDEGEKMDIQDFEALFIDKKKTLDEMEAFWNDRAKGFYETQKNSPDNIGEIITQFLVDEEILALHSSVIDIGSGSGRYTIPLAKIAQEVTALDLSESMLQFLQQEVESLGIDNVKTVHAPWGKEASKNKYSVAFSAMCSGIKSIKALEAMSEAATEYGVIVRYIKKSDDILEKYAKVTGNNEFFKSDARSNRETVQAFFNILWMLGYEPKIHYIDHVVDVQTTKEQLQSLYLRVYANDIDLATIKKLLDEKSTRDSLQVRKIYRLAILYWKTNEDN